MAVSDIPVLSLIQWRDRLDRVPGKLLSSNHKIVVYHLEVVFVTHEKDEIGFYLVVIGRLPKRNNMVGVTGLSDWTIRGVINDLELNHFLKKIVTPGTAEENYMDKKLYLKPNPELWVPEKFRIIEKSSRHRRKPRCPHCMTVLVPGSVTYICHACGSQFGEPFFTKD